MSYGTAGIRNVALVGHAGSGKTTLAEALLHAGGAIATKGSIEQGSTVSDFDPLERTRGHSIDTSVTSIDVGECHINLLDAPGYPEFRGTALSALAVVETCAIVVNATTGVEPTTRWLMGLAKERGLCRVIIVNKIDIAERDLGELMDALRDELGAMCLPINLPNARRDGVLDCFFADGGSDAAFSSVAEAHRTIFDRVVEIDDSVLSHYFDEGEKGLRPEELHDAFEKCLREGHVVPICFVSARTGAGVKELLSLIERLFPNPTEANPPRFTRVRGDESVPHKVVPDDTRHVVADVFKIVNDPFVGTVGVFRVYQGTIVRDGQLFVDDARKSFKVGHLVRLQGSRYVEIPRAIAGDIAAIAKVDAIHFDAVLHDSHDEDHIKLEPVAFPTPMFGLAIEPSQPGKEHKLADALAALSSEDPCFRVEHRPELRETVILGLSELHLRIVIDRIRARHRVEVTTRAPRIAYRETVSQPAEGHCRHKKQTGGAGQFAEVWLRVEPLPRGSGFEFVDAVKGGTIPIQFIPAVEKGVRQVAATGAVAGYPIEDVRVVVYEGKHHPVDSKEIAFITAGRKALLDAIQKAGPVVLEPFVNLEVHVPERSVGDVTGSLATRRAHIEATLALSDEVQIRARAPLAELGDFDLVLKAMTGGQGRHSFEPSHYEATLPNVQSRLIEEYRATREED